MAKILYVAFAILIAATVALAAKKEGTCSPWLEYCQVYEDCCRHLQCSGYQAKCVPVGGLVIPGKDTRPVGPGPFPPGYIE